MGVCENKKTPRSRVDLKEQAILNAVRTLVATQSFWDTSTRQIAAQAGVSEGTIYHYFKNKKLLLESVVQKNYSDLAQNITNQLIGEASFSTQMLTFLELSLLEFSAVNGVFVHFVAAYWVACEPDYESYWSTIELRLAEDYVNLSKGILERGIAAGEIEPEMDVAELNYIFMGILERTTYYLIDGGNAQVNVRGVVGEVLDFLSPLMATNTDKMTVDASDMENLCQRLESGLFRLKSLKN